MSASRRRRKDQIPEQLASIETIIAQRIEAALEAPPGSKAAIGNAQEAIFLSVRETMKALQPALAPLLEAADLHDAAAIRKSWIGKLRFLNGCLALPDLNSLSIALMELGRGVPASALLPDGNMQGGKSNTERLRLMAYAVEAADELKRRCIKDAEYRAELTQSETAHSTIEKYRKAIREIPEFAPRIGWSLYWTDAPEIVLQQLIWAIKALDNHQ
ncbi:hypothetical protein GCM10022276_19810 [Sphingomonas limnosediminicola]|uniref:Uncharacterized protein n=1 Tax=Sphingomonas limnosediminicola TaxID=940133 RepID=A0ABP7LI41_9SPHN